MDKEATRRLIFTVVEDLFTDFSYYDRKPGSSMLDMHTLNDAVRTGIVTGDEIIEKFSTCVRNFEKWIKANPEL